MSFLFLILSSLKSVSGPQGEDWESYRGSPLALAQEQGKRTLTLMWMAGWGVTSTCFLPFVLCPPAPHPLGNPAVMGRNGSGGRECLLLLLLLSRFSRVRLCEPIDGT